MPFAAEEANAQTASGHVFTAGSEIHNHLNDATNVDLADPLLTIIADLRVDVNAPGSVFDQTFAGAWSLLDRGSSFVAVMTVGALGAEDGNSLITFADNSEMQGGDLVRYTDGNGSYTLTIRIYDIGGVLYAAMQERATDAVAADGEFYLSTNGWTVTRTPSSDVFGYVAPICDEGFFLPPDGDGSMCVEMEEEETPVSVSAAARTESKVRDNAWTAFGGALAVGVLSYLLSDGTLLGYSATPDFGYSLTESGYAVNAGGRVDFRKDRWHLYWTAGQQSVNGDFGDFRYSSGGKWQGDIFAAAFSEKVQGKTADYDLSLSANWTGGIWKISPAFAIDSVYEKGEFQTTNSFRINGEMRYDDWHFSASGNKTQMQLSATLEF